MADKLLCSVPGCGNDARKRGWCGKHYQRWANHGDANITIKVGRKPLAKISNGQMICTDCEQAKPLNDFPEAPTGAEGRRLQCLPCFRQRKRRSYSNVGLVDRQAKHRRAYRAQANCAKARLENNVSARIWYTLHRRRGAKFGATTKEILGYTIDALVRHLERQFEPGMSWANYGQRGWHIDHVVPLIEFQYTSFSDVEFRRAWALANLRPLWGDKNISKGAHRTHLL